MKNLTGIYLLLVFLTASLRAPAQGTEGDQMTIQLSNPGQPGLLSANLVSGSILVTGYKGDEVIIQVSGRADSKKMKNGMKRIANGPGGMTVTEQDNTVEINAAPWDDILSLDIRVPYNFSLKVGTVNNGVVKIEGVSGELEVSNVNGDVIIHDVSGAAVVNTVNGMVKAVFSEIEEDLPMAFSTLNGDIDVTFPAGVKAVIKMKTQQGDIFSDFDLEIENKVKMEKSNKGPYKISNQSWVYGKVNGGGQEIMMKSMNGNIYVRKAR